MLYIFGIYLFFGILQVLIFLSCVRSQKIVMAKSDKFQLFMLCCVLAIAYPYMAIHATYNKFTHNKTQVIDAETVK
jgi:hypothetical protein